MYRHSPVRNQRSKGINIKYVLQVCLLVAICFWLIFQVKRSHDKKKEFAMKLQSSTQTESIEEIVKFGRKDLKPKLDETSKEIDVHEEDQEHEQEEEEDQEHDEEEQEEDKIEEEKDDGDEIDESDQEKSDLESDREEMETIDEDKETEETESEEKDEQIQTENGVSSDNHDDENGTIGHNHEAREEQYKADDASSAVTHDARTLGSEKENGNQTLDNGEQIKNGTFANYTMIQEKDSESMVETSMNASKLIDSHENGPSSSTITSIPDSTPAQNTTERFIDSGEQTDNSTITAHIEEAQEPSNSSNLAEVSEPHGSKTEDTGKDPLKTELKTNSGEDESKTDKKVESSGPNALQHDTIDPLKLVEPKIEKEGGNSEDTAAE